MSRVYTSQTRSILTSRLLLIVGCLIIGFSSSELRAQGELAATLEVLAEGVEVQRVNTVNWIGVKVEAIVGVGDTIRTNATGRARITFFKNGAETDLLPNTEYQINRFSGDEQSFQISVAVLAGQTAQRLARLLDANSNYSVTTPGLVLAARGTQFNIRVEGSGRSAMLVSNGIVAASAQEAEAPVNPGFGVRADASGALSDVVPATTFDQLDAALDGCPGTLDIKEDISLIVRLGAGAQYPRIGVIDPRDVTLFMGINQSGGWYRIPFRGGFGWIARPQVSITRGCAGLRPFDDGYGPENLALYESLGNPIQTEDIRQQLQAAGLGLEVTPEAAPGS